MPRPAPNRVTGPRIPGSATPPLIVAPTRRRRRSPRNRRHRTALRRGAASLRRGVDHEARPGTVRRRHHLDPRHLAPVVVDPRFGLASHDRAGRAHAVSRVRAIRDAVSRLVDDADRQVVLAVQVYTAPRVERHGPRDRTLRLADRSTSLGERLQRRPRYHRPAGPIGSSPAVCSPRPPCAPYSRRSVARVRCSSA